MNNVFRKAMFMLGFLGGASLAQVPTPTSTSTGQSAPALSPGKLDQLVAPIALYPDALISHVLPASRTPIDVVRAARHLRQHGGKLDETPDNNWNISVTVLMKFPDVLYKTVFSLMPLPDNGAVVTQELLCSSVGDVPLAADPTWTPPFIFRSNASAWGGMLANIYASRRRHGLWAYRESQPP